MSGMMGQRILRREDARFLRGEGLYVENLDAPGRAARDVRPLAVRACAHRRASTRRRLPRSPGTQVFTAADVELRHVPAAADSRVSISGWDDRSSRATSSASWATSSPSSSPRAAPTASTPPSSSSSTTSRCRSSSTRERALAGDVLLFPEAGTNVCASHPAEARRDAVRGLRRRSSRGAWSASGWRPARSSSRLRRSRRRRRAADAVALDPDAAPGPRRPGARPRPRRRPTCASSRRTSAAGSAPRCLAVEEILVAWLARTTGRPVRWTETRSENMIAMHHGRGAVLDFTIGGSRDGDVQAYRLRILQDVGAYPGHRSRPPAASPR